MRQSVVVWRVVSFSLTCTYGDRGLTMVRICFLVILAIWVKRLETSMSVIPKPADASSRHCFGSQNRVPPGGHSRKSMDIGTRSIAGSVDGAMRVFFRHCMNISTRSPVKSLRSSLIRRWCVRIPVQPVLKKRRTRGASSRT